MPEAGPVGELRMVDGRCLQSMDDIDFSVRGNRALRKWVPTREGP